MRSPALILTLFCAVDAALLSLAVAAAALLASALGPDAAPWVLAALPVLFLPVLALAHWLASPVWERLLNPPTPCPISAPARTQNVAATP